MHTPDSPLRRRRPGRAMTPHEAALQRLEELSTGIAETLINAMEAKNPYLRGHSQRVADLSASTAEMLGLTPDVVEEIRLAGRLHDVGKIGIRESVLDKPGPLDAEEYAHVQTHVRIGLEILAPLTHLGRVLDFIGDHHERLDGAGYPQRLAGEAISLGGRIIAAADTFDALTTRRAYRDARSEAETLTYMQHLVGASLFPDVFDALRRVIELRQSLVFLGDMRAPGAYVSPVGRGLDELVAAIRTLPADERLAVTLHYLEGLQDAEVASAMDADPATVADLRRRALARLARAG